jgi:hypothetical protein
VLDHAAVTACDPLEQERRYRVVAFPVRADARGKEESALGIKSEAARKRHHAAHVRRRFSKPAAERLSVAFESEHCTTISVSAGRAGQQKHRNSLLSFRARALDETTTDAEPGLRRRNDEAGRLPRQRQRRSDGSAMGWE